MILLKRQYREVWAFLIVNIYYFWLSLIHLLKTETPESWHNWLFNNVEQVAKLKKTWNLTPVLQIVQKIPENYCPCLYLSVGQVWWLNEMWFKRYIYSKIQLVSCTNTHHDATDLVNHGMVKNTKNLDILRMKHNFSTK